MKIITSTLAALFLLSALAVPAHAQEDIVNLLFRVTVAGTPCPNATYWGLFGMPNTDDVTYVQLTDADGDGIYVGAGAHTAGRLVVQIIEGTGVGTATTIGGGSTFEVPGEPSRVIQDFGVNQPDQPDYIVPHLIVTEDMTFEASVSGCPAGLPDTGINDELPVAPVAGGLLLLVTGAYVRRRLWQHA